MIVHHVNRMEQETRKAGEEKVV